MEKKDGAELDVFGEYFAGNERKREPGGLPGFEGLAPDEQAKAERRMFREVFGTPHGRIVLTQILIDLKYFDKCITADDTALCNYAKYLVQERLDINDTHKIVTVLMGGGAKE